MLGMKQQERQNVKTSKERDGSQIFHRFIHHKDSATRPPLVILTFRRLTYAGLGTVSNTC